MAANRFQPSQAERWISRSRFDAFLAEAGGDQVRAYDLYVWNAQLAGALLETFGHVEVLVRNVVHVQLRSVRPDNSLQSWLLDPDLLTAEDIRRVEEVIGRIKRAKKLPDEDRVLAGLSMGFWTGIVGKRYEELWRHTLRHAFPHGDGTRHEVAGYLNRIVTLRNRVAHHEALISHPVGDRHADALALAGTIDPDAEAWVRSVSRVQPVLDARP